MECKPWDKVEPIIITIPNETREIVKEYLEKRRLKKQLKARKVPVK